MTDPPAPEPMTQTSTRSVFTGSPSFGVALRLLRGAVACPKGRTPSLRTRADRRMRRTSRGSGPSRRWRKRVSAHHLFDHETSSLFLRQEAKRPPEHGDRRVFDEREEEATTPGAARSPGDEKAIQILGDVGARKVERASFEDNLGDVLERASLAIGERASRFELRQRPARDVLERQRHFSIPSRSSAPDGPATRLSRRARAGETTRR